VIAKLIEVAIEQASRFIAGLLPISFAAKMI
jgi:hypothetical protein